MGLLDKLLRRGKKEKVGGAAKYILKRQGKGGGMKKVSDLLEPTPIEDLYESLTPGIYSLHKYQKGKVGFEVVWGPVEVLGEAATPNHAASPRQESPFAGLREYAEQMKATKADLVDAFTILGPMMGFSPPGEGKAKTIIEQLKEAKQDLRDLQDIFPSATTGSQEIPIEGSIPAWMAFAPKVVDTSMNAIEERLLRWGFISHEDTVTGKREEFIDLPNRPAAAKSRAKQPEAEKTEDIVPKVEIPERPEAAKEVVIKSDKKGENKKGDEKSGSGGDKSAKES